MAKTVSKTISERARQAGVRDRDTESPHAPTHVTDPTLPRAFDLNIARKAQFGGYDREVLLSERPRTSAGPASQPSFRRTGSRRETKDDLFINPLAAHRIGTTFYDFPLPGRTPTPTEKISQPDFKAPGSSTPPSQKSSVAQRPILAEKMTTQYATMVAPEMEIGMALGSPSQQPQDWYQQPRTEVTKSPTSDTMNNSVANNVVPPVKPKKSKWGVFEGLFGGKKNVGAQQQSFYQLQPGTTPQPTSGVSITTRADNYLNFAEPPPPPEEKSKGRSRGRSISTRKTKTKTPKPDMKRANTLPVRQDGSEFSGPGAPTITLEGGLLTDHHPPLKKANGQPGHQLDVDIPSIQMERYSIMFGSVLQNQPNNSASLLARRQATLDRLKMANDALASKEQELYEREKKLMPRRATSPQPTKSPAFSLFPNTPSRTSHREHSPSRSRQGGSGLLHRSNTSPAALSPSRPTFAPGPDNEAHAIIVGISSPAVVTPRLSEDSFPPPLTATNNKSRSDSVGRISAKEHGISNSFPGSVDGTETYTLSPLHDSQPLKPHLFEPAWEIINRSPEPKTPIVTPATASSNGSGHSTSTSVASSSASVSTTATTISVPIMFNPSTAKTLQVNPHLPPSSTSRTRRNDSNASDISLMPLDEAEARLKSAAEVSIARQISVSRRQRQLLVPINTMRRTPSNASVTGNKKHNANFPSPVTQTIKPVIGVARAASPLGAVATAAKEERARPLATRSKSSPLAERLQVVTARKPNTPTLVVVSGPKDNDSVKSWEGNTTTSPLIQPGTPVQPVNLSIAERRRGKEMGEIKVGLSVRRRERERREGEGKRATERIQEAVKEGGMQHRQRKSERAIVERISVASN